MERCYLHSRKLLSSFIVIVCFLHIGLFSSCCFAQEQKMQPTVLRVGIIDYPPYVMINAHHEYRGLIIDMWSAIAKILGYKYTFVQMGDDVDQNVVSLSKGVVDVLLGPVVMTYFRRETVAFTRPYAISNIGIVVPIIKKSLPGMFFSLIKDFLNISLLFAFVGLLIYVHLLWFFERGKLDAIPTSYVKGINELFWSTLVRAKLRAIPTTATARVIHFLWILGSAALLSVLYATVITSVHFSYINEPVKIDSKLDKVAAIKGTASYDYADAAGYQIITVANRAEGMDMVLNKKVRGYVEDETTAYYYLRVHHLLDKLQLSPNIIKTEIMGIGLPIGSPLISKINEALSYLQDQGIVLNFCKKQMGSTRAGSVCF